ncbi:MAG: tetratricopeptide repeat protein, partial [Alphaproteobacteria bacterium]|nr:tetratricopeptide repeat protein [Alphaproteobacteria bacterium]
IADFTAAIDVNSDNIDSLFERGWAYHLSNNFAPAIADLSKVIDRYPTYAPAYRLRGLAYAAIRDFDKAVADDTAAISLDPENGDAYFNRGLARAAQGSHVEAVTDFNAVLARDPKDEDALTNRALSRQALGDDKGAIEDFSGALAIRPDAASYNNRGISLERLHNTDAALADYRAAMTADPGDADALQNLSRLLEEQDKPAEAVTVFTRFLASHPDNVTALGGRGYAYFLLEDWAKCVADETAVIALHPNDHAAYFLRGLAAQQFGDYDVALASFDKAVSFGGELLGSYLAARAYLKRMLGDADGADRDGNAAAAFYDRAIAGAPNNGQLYSARGALRAIQHKWADAIDDQDRALAIKPDDPNVLSTRGNERLGANDYDGALADFAKALALDPKLGSALLGQALALTFKRDAVQALATYDRLLAIHPGSPGILTNRCYTRAMLNRDLDAALSDCQAALSQVPQSAPTIGNLALVQFRMGERDAALQTLGTLLKRYPNAPWALYLRGAIQGPDGTADRALAASVDPDVVDEFAAFGLAS